MCKLRRTWAVGAPFAEPLVFSTAAIMSNFSDAVQTMNDKVAETKKDVVPNDVEQVAEAAEKEGGRAKQEVAEHGAPLAADAKNATDAPDSADAEGNAQAPQPAGSTTVYTEAKPEVLESADHHVVTQSIPITHTSVPDYNEAPTAAPPIVGGDLYSILRQSGEQRSSEYTPAVATVEQADVRETWTTERSALDTGAAAAVGATAGGVPAYLANSMNSKPNVPWASASAQQEAPAPDAPSKEASATEAPAGAAASQAGLERFEPTDEQAWSVRGPASNVVSRGPHDLAHREAGAGAAGAAGASAGVPSKGQDVAGSAENKASDAAKGAESKAGDAVKNAENKAGDAVKGAESKAGDAVKDTEKKVGDAAKAPGDAVKNAESKAGDAVKSAEKKAGDAVNDVKSKPADAAKQAEQKVGAAKKQGAEAVDSAKQAGKAKKGGFMSKLKKALHIGKENK